MEELQIFKNEEFGTIRTTEIDGEPYFVGKDVCEAFGDTNYRRSLNRIDESDKGVSQIATPGGTQSMTVINESGLYSLLFQMQPQKGNEEDATVNARIEKLHRFKHWVTSDVLPAIRKTGGYIGNQENMSDDEIMAKALLVAQKTIEQRNKQIEAMQPKALFADAVASSDTSILMNDLAKLIKQNGVDIGGSRLWTWMRDNGYIFKHSCEPTQKAMELRLFEVIERTIQRSNHAPKVTRTTKVTGKGQIYFLNKFVKQKEAES